MALMSSLRVTEEKRNYEWMDQEGVRIKTTYHHPGRSGSLNFVAYGDNMIKGKHKHITLTKVNTNRGEWNAKWNTCWLDGVWVAKQSWGAGAFTKHLFLLIIAIPWPRTSWLCSSCVAKVASIFCAQNVS
jgi:hypothetical protein